MMETVEQKYLAILMGAVLEMRHHQRNYFAHRRDDDKKKSIAMETRVDRICMQLRLQGIKPIINQADQKELF